MSEDFDKDATLAKIKEQIAENNTLLYMKGSPEQPQCGFSNLAVRILKACGQSFASVDILSNPDIRATLPEYAEWPTFPQLYIKGELIGGSDIMQEMYEEGELQDKIDATATSKKSEKADESNKTDSKDENEAYHTDNDDKK
jgi:monothiol glutaredoxin